VSPRRFGVGRRPADPADAAAWGPHDASAPALSQGASSGDPALRAELETPEAARYHPDHLLGQGGMGRVTSVYDRRLGRWVALKEPRRAGADADDLAHRLAREARITAQLQHPGIVPIYDAGTGPDGLVYYTMPIVEGHTLADELRRSPPPTARRRLLRRVLEACEAVAWAHKQGVVHRDLKPSNIMLEEGRGTRVLDWGLARLLGGDPGWDAAEDPPPEPGADPVIAGTPRYMSPEQARGASADRRSDVWSLGAILFEVATGRPLREPAETDALTRVPPRGVPAELAAIIARATEAEPDARYPDARGLADDLERLLEGRAVEAHTYSTRELLTRLVRAWRYPLLVAAIALVVIAALTVIGVTRLASVAERAVVAEGEARAAAARSSRDLASSLHAQALLRSDAGARPEAEVLATHALTMEESPEMRGVLALWGASAAPELVERRPLPDCERLALDGPAERLLCLRADEISGWQLRPLRLLWRRAGGPRQAVWAGATAVVQLRDEGIQWLDGATGDTLRVAPDHWLLDTLDSVGDRAVGGTAVSGTSFGADGPPGEVVHACPHTEGIMMLTFTVDATGRRWAATCGDGSLVTGELGQPRERWHQVATPLEGPQVVLALAFLDAERLVAGTGDGSVALLEASSGAVLSLVRTRFNQVTELRVAASGDLVLAFGASGGPVVVSPRTAAAWGRLPEPRASLVTFDGDDALFGDTALERWRLEPSAPAWLDLTAGLTSLALDPTGRYLGLTTVDRAEVRRASDGAVLVSTASAGAKSIAFTVDGGFVSWVAAHDARVRTWETETWRELPPQETLIHRRVVALAGGGLAALPYAGDVLIYPPPGAAAGASEPPWPALGEDAPPRFADLAATPDGAWAVALDEREHRIWRLEAATRRFEVVARDPRARAVAIGGGGQLVVSAGEDGVRVWEAGARALRAELPAPGVVFEEVALGRDDGVVAAGARDGSIWLWDQASGRLLAHVRAHRERVPTLAFSPDGRVLVSGSWDGRVRFLDLTHLDTPGAELLERVDRRWGLSLSDVLERR